MLGKIKSVLGIEGVKVEIRVHEPLVLSSKLVKGELVFRTLTKQFIKSAVINLKEYYKKGRGKSKTKEVFSLGEIEIDILKTIEKDGVLMVPFEFPFLHVISDMENFGNKNIITNQLANLAHFLKNAHSEMIVNVETKIEASPLGASSKLKINYI